MQRRGSSGTPPVGALVSAPPKVDVLMATYNGRRWIEQQVDSILCQQGVDVTLVVSDDGSHDGTREYLERRSAVEPRLVVLPPRAGASGVTANFMYLLMSHPQTDDRFVALSDQDDVWFPGKLRTQLELMRSTGAVATSSDVVSFAASGARRLIVKSGPQRRWDYIFEAAGPGSTYVFSPEMHARLLPALSMLDLSEIGVHDWFLYALVRALGGQWTIGSEPTVAYRQHQGNVQGENHGLHALTSRLKRLRSGFYRNQFILVARACLLVGSGSHDHSWTVDLEDLISDLEHKNMWSRIRIAKRYREIRRNRREGLELALACLLHLW